MMDRRLVAACGFLVFLAACGTSGNMSDAATSDSEATDTALDGAATDAATPTGTNGSHCGDGGVACAAPTMCIPTQFFDMDLSICYDASRGRCGNGNCDCAAPYQCFASSFAHGANEGYCMTQEEANQLCALPGQTFPCQSGVATPFAGCP